MNSFWIVVLSIGRLLDLHLMLLAGAFIGILAATLSARPDVPFGIIVLGLMGLLGGHMMYRWKMGIASVTVVVVAVTIAAMALGPMGQHREAGGALVQGPVGSGIAWANGTVDAITGNQPAADLGMPRKIAAQA